MRVANRATCVCRRWRCLNQGLFRSAAQADIYTRKSFSVPPFQLPSIVVVRLAEQLLKILTSVKNTMYGDDVRC